MRIEPESTPTSRRSRSSLPPVRDESTVSSVASDLPVNESPARSPQKKSFFTTKAISIGIVILGLLAFAGYSRYEIYQLGKMKDPAYQQALVEQQTKSITDQVSRLMLLPEGIPQIATVSDVDTLKKTQPFFVNAQNGDNVLIYTNEAILYRSSTQKIINVAPISRDQSPQAQTSPPAQMSDTGGTTGSGSVGAKSSSTSTTTSGAKEPVKTIKK